MARVLAGRAELCACDVQAGLGIGVRSKNYSQYGLPTLHTTGAGDCSAPHAMKACFIEC